MEGAENMMKTYTVDQVANWFLSKESMSPKKLQKLTYYFEAWGNALYEESLINDTSFEAWVHGPVSPKLYHEYKEYGWREIEKRPNSDELFEDKALDLLESVWITYGDETPNSLEAITHAEYPWQKARLGLEPLENGDNVIQNKDMADYYKAIYIGD